MTVETLDDDCGCVCNHSGACTGCGVCYVAAWRQVHGRAPVSLPVPRDTTDAAKEQNR